MGREKLVEHNIRVKIWLEPKSFCMKIHADGMQGKNTLDLIGAYKGRPFMIEVKAPDGVPSMIQEALVRRFQKCGYVAGVVSSWDEFKALFD
jgi:hypothetical protein